MMNKQRHTQTLTYGWSNYRYYVPILIWLVCLSSYAPAQSIYFNRVFPPEGKVFEHITGLVQDRQGYMWLTSKKGLYRYDGYKMVLFKNNPLDPASLATDQLETIVIDANGIIWIGTLGAGLERLDPTTGMFTHYRHDPKDSSSINSNWISALLVDRDGSLWIGGDGLDRFDSKTGHFIHYRNQPGDSSSLSSNEVIAIYEDRKGELWIGTGSVYGALKNNLNVGGLNRMNKNSGRVKRYMHDPSNPHSLVSNKVRAIFEDSRGTFWVGTAGDGLHTMDRGTGKFQRHSYDPNNPEKLSRPAVKKEYLFDHISFIREDTTGAIWIGTTESGINYFDPETGKVQHFESGKDSAGAFTDRTAWCAYTSREGVLWISTLHGSLYRINTLHGKIPSYSTKGAVNSIYVQPNGTLWVGTEQEGIIVKDSAGRTIRQFVNEPSNPKSLSTNIVQQIKLTRAGDLWVATFGGGLNLLDQKKGTFTRYLHDPKNNQSLSHNAVIYVYEDPDSEIWVCTMRGLNRLNKKTNTFTHYVFYPDDTVSLGVNTVTSVIKDRQGKWWAGLWMRGGIQQFNPSNRKFKTYLRGASIFTIYEDAAGTIWAGGNEGLFHYNRNVDSFFQYSDPLYMAETNVGSLIEDDQGNLWATSISNIVKINKERNESVIFGKYYGISEGQMRYGAVYKDQKGKLYFGFWSGYYAFFPDQLTKGIRPPEIIISEFRIANKLITAGKDSRLTEPLSLVDRIHLRHNENIFSFEFAGIDYSNPEDNKHLFMLENYDAGWNLAGAERKAIYFNVPPGKYVFRVKVQNSYGIWAEKSIEVIITPPWWNTWWFRIAAVLIIAGTFYAIIRWRVRQKFHRQLERSEKDKQLAELRQKTGELEMQALRAQMNPHFVFNSLNAINRFILQNNKTQASEYLTKFSRLVRMILQNSQSTLITLESELDSLRLYLELEALRFDNRFEYKISVPKDLDIDILKVPPLIIQPYAENAIWHGLMHKEEKGHLEIDITQEGENLLFRIKDDGIGRQQSAAMTSKSATRHKSMGLKITADRIAMLQRSVSPQSPVVINDLVNADGSPAGTEVLIKIPVTYD